MSAENGKLVALRAALFHSVPAHVHELRRQASQLKDENDELMSYAYSQTRKLKLEIFQRKCVCAEFLIAYSHDFHRAWQNWELWLLAGHEDRPLPKTKLQKKKIVAQVEENIREICAEINIRSVFFRDWGRQI